MRGLRRAVYYSSMRTPLGGLLLAATRNGVVRVAFGGDEAGFVADLRRRLRGAKVMRSPRRVARVVSQLEAYFGGRKLRLSIPVDVRGLTSFERRVLDATRQVPPGRVVSYGEIARRIGHPRASRAVGQALGRNPVPILIPCHRVVTSHGGLGGYTGGVALKKKLLRIEGAPVIGVGS